MNNGIVFVLITVTSTVFSQIFFKIASKNITENFNFFSFFSPTNYFLYAGLLFSVISIISWVLGLSKLPLSYAYPFMSLCFPLVLLVSKIVFAESISLHQVAGILIIVFGLLLMSFDYS